MTPRADITAKWALYGLVCLVAAIAQQLLLDNLTILGATPFLLPILVAVIAAAEGSTQGTVFAIVFAVICELGGSAPVGGLYVVSFVTAALIVSLIAKYWVSGSIVGGFVYAAIAFFITDFYLGAYLMIFRHAAMYSLCNTAVRELLASILFVIPIYPIVAVIKRKYLYN